MIYDKAKKSKSPKMNSMMTSEEDPMSPLGNYDSPESLFDMDLMAQYKAQKGLLTQNLRLAQNNSSFYGKK